MSLPEDLRMECWYKCTRDIPGKLNYLAAIFQNEGCMPRTQEELYNVLLSIKDSLDELHELRRVIKEHYEQRET